MCRGQNKKSGQAAFFENDSKLPDHLQLMVTVSAYFHIFSVE